MRSPFSPNAVAALAVLVATACGSTDTNGSTHAAPSPDEIVLRWAVRQELWGSEAFEVRGDGRAVYTMESFRGRPPERRELTISATQLEAVRATFEEHDFCDLESDRAGIPDEGR